MRNRSGPIRIVGAGPAGLAAAIAVARSGREVLVTERHTHVGMRFHDDFQGLENWSTDADVLDELRVMGIEPSFEYTPFHECTFFDPEGREHLCRSDRPLWYLVRRGPVAGSLDRSLEEQAIAAGAAIDYGETTKNLPEGGIVAHGPRRVDAIAVGYVFETDRPNGAFGAVSNRLAPGGYAYLLIREGRATLATCIFSDFHNESTYLERTVDLFRQKVGIVLSGERRFGGFGNMSWVPVLRRGKRLLVGEAAALQDALFGFGMRYAMVSGHLAGTALAQQAPEAYADAARSRGLLRLAKVSGVNRYLYERAGERGYRAMLEQLSRGDARPWLRGHYNGHWWTPLLYPLASREARRRQRRNLAEECRDACDCTWCRCTREIHASAFADEQPGG